MAYSTKSRNRRNFSGSFTRPSRFWDAVAILSTKSGDYEYTPCAYCGEPHDAEDHVYPVRHLSSLSMLSDTEREMLILVPVCDECNGYAGDTVDASFEDRRERVQSILRSRYRQYLNRPEWDEEEMADFGEALGGHIGRGNYEQARLIARSSYDG